MALFDLNSYVNGNWAPKDNNATPFIAGAEDWGLSGVSPTQGTALADWLQKYRETGVAPGPMPQASDGGYDFQATRDGGGQNIDIGNFKVDPKTGAMTQVGDWGRQRTVTSDGAMFAQYLAGLAAMVGGAGALTGAGGAGGAAGGAAAGGGGATNAALIDSALNSAGYGASSAGAGLGAYESGAGLLAGAANTNATNPALIDSALGTPGYGVSSAGAGGGAGTGLFGGLGSSVTDAMKKIGIPSLGNLGDLAKVGGLLGAVGAGSQGGQDPYTGPMPTITRGNWSPTATPQYMDVAQPSLMSADIKKQANSGLWRFMGGT